MCVWFQKFGNERVALPKHDHYYHYYYYIFICLHVKLQIYFPSHSSGQKAALVECKFVQWKWNRKLCYHVTALCVFQPEEEFYVEDCKLKCRCNAPFITCEASDCPPMHECKLQNGDLSCYPSGKFAPTVHAGPPQGCLGWRLAADLEVVRTRGIRLFT